jgi:hypothetical protein
MMIRTGQTVDPREEAENKDNGAQESFQLYISVEGAGFRVLGLPEYHPPRNSKITRTRTEELTKVQIIVRRVELR